MQPVMSHWYLADPTGWLRLASNHHHRDQPDPTHIIITTTTVSRFEFSCPECAEDIAIVSSASQHLARF